MSIEEKATQYAIELTNKTLPERIEIMRAILNLMVNRKEVEELVREAYEAGFRAYEVAPYSEGTVARSYQRWLDVPTRQSKIKEIES